MTVIAVLALAAASYTIAQGVVIPALAEIEDHVATTGEAATFAFLAYLVSASVATPILGKLGDIYGKRRLLLIMLLTSRPDR